MHFVSKNNGFFLISNILRENFEPEEISGEATMKSERPNWTRYNIVRIARNRTVFNAIK